MIMFILPKSYYIRNFDKHNWIIAKKLKAKKTGKKKEYVEGYYPTLEQAFNRAVKLFALQAKDKNEILSVLFQMSLLKGTSDFQDVMTKKNKDDHSS